MTHVADVEVNNAFQNDKEPVSTVASGNDKRNAPNRIMTEKLNDTIL